MGTGERITEDRLPDTGERIIEATCLPVKDGFVDIEKALEDSYGDVVLISSTLSKWKLLFIKKQFLCIVHSYNRKRFPIKLCGEKLDCDWGSDVIALGCSAEGIFVLTEPLPNTPSMLGYRYVRTVRSEAYIRNVLKKVRSRFVLGKTLLCRKV